MPKIQQTDPETGEVQEIELSKLYAPRNGAEMPDPRPMQIPVGFRRPETLAEQVQRLVRTSISRHAEMQGFETFEESEDFDVGDDFDPRTPYETYFDPILGKDVSADEFRRNQAIYKQRFEKKGKNISRQDLFKALGIDPEEHRSSGTKTPESNGGEDVQPDGAGATQ